MQLAKNGNNAFLRSLLIKINMTELLLKRKYMRHISHCRLVPAVSSHGLTHCARCRLVCYIVPPRMHTVV